MSGALTVRRVPLTVCRCEPQQLAGIRWPVREEDYGRSGIWNGEHGKCPRAINAKVHSTSTQLGGARVVVVCGLDAREEPTQPLRDLLDRAFEFQSLNLQSGVSRFGRFRRERPVLQYMRTGRE